MKLRRELVVSTLAAAGVFVLVQAGWHPTAVTKFGADVFLWGSLPEMLYGLGRVSTLPLAGLSAVGTFLCVLAWTWPR